MRKILARLHEARSPGDEAFLAGYLKRHPRMRRFFGPGKLEQVKSVSQSFGSEEASTRSLDGKMTVTLSPKFWTFQPDLQYSIFTHELGHVLSGLISTSSWVKQATSLGLDVWAASPRSMEMPFQLNNVEEAFAATFSVLARKDSRGIGLLKKHWPLWIELVTWAGKREGVL